MFFVQYKSGKHKDKFRLEQNWQYKSFPQLISIEVELDDIDKNNIYVLIDNKDYISNAISRFSPERHSIDHQFNEKYTINVEIGIDQSVTVKPSAIDFGYTYLRHYHLFRKAIELHNRDPESQLIDILHNPFCLIGCYRNYSSFTPVIKLNDKLARYNQTNRLERAIFSQSTNLGEHGEPNIFSLVRLKMAAHHQRNMEMRKSKEDCNKEVNTLPFVKSINEKLKIINLKLEIALIDHPGWEYSFSFYYVNSNRKLDDINDLSAGQKAIMHLIFEAYGRGGLKGGVIIIDEPEIHLHYQFQNEYLRMLENLIDEHQYQCILVTHSDSLINSKTINYVLRFGLDDNKNTAIYYQNEQYFNKNLVKILDNTRSTYAFFAKKVVLVEGQTDRYFFQEVLKLQHPSGAQDIAVLSLDGKGNYTNWFRLFNSFGLDTHYICDFDNAKNYKLISDYNSANEKEIIARYKKNKFDNLSSEKTRKLMEIYIQLTNDPENLTQEKLEHCLSLAHQYKSYINLSKAEKQEIIHNEIVTKCPEITEQIRKKYKDNIYILMHGELECYTNTGKDLDKIIKFCNNNLEKWLNSDSEKASEILCILSEIIK